jgi:hypothetical protein
VKALFNASCDCCRTWGPGRARVYLRHDWKATEFRRDPTVLCAACRQRQQGNYRLDERHK